MADKGSWLQVFRGSGSGNPGYLAHRGGSPIGHGVRTVSESAVTGAALGVVASRLGTLDWKRSERAPAIPLDLGLAVLGFAASLVPAAGDHGVDSDFRNVGAAAATIYAFRQVERIATAARLKPNPVAMTGGQVAAQMGAANINGEPGSDPILTAAQFIT